MGIVDILTVLRNQNQRTINYKAVTIIFLIVLSELPAFRYVSAQKQDNVVSGSFVSSFLSDYGNSVFTVEYNYMSTLRWGKNFTVSCLLEINQLSGLKEYIGSYALVLTMYGSNGYVLMGRTMGGYPSSFNVLYAGSHWGPINVTVPVNRTSFGNPSEQNFTSNLSLELIAQVQFSNSVNGVGQIESETNTSAIGAVSIISPAGNSAIDYYILGAGIGGVIVVISLVALLRRRDNATARDATVTAPG